MDILSNEGCCIAVRLRQARNRAGISQKWLGELAGFDPGSASARVNQYETGKHTPHFNVLKLLGQVLEVPVSFFYEEDDEIAELILGLHRLPDFRKKEILSELASVLNLDATR